MVKINSILTQKEIDFLKQKLDFPDEMSLDDFAELGDQIIDLEASAVMNRGNNVKEISDILTKITTSKEWSE
ncbi:MAG: hypothetical protein ACLSXK_09310 [Lactococcus petauri]|uniref:hypothetical protein n=1 Tax=Lactococcus petauri TaxID=1940789 RepID=UPI0018A9F07F|nr:hypothetical protein [Lactococcus petauri]MDC0826999.1 hypothetical protein [Lactococcus petauri]